MYHSIQPEDLLATIEDGDEEFKDRIALLPGMGSSAPPWNYLGELGPPAVPNIDVYLRVPSAPNPNSCASSSLITNFGPSGLSHPLYGMSIYQFQQ